MKKAKRKAAAAQARCVLDSGGLSGLLGRSQRSRAWLRWIVEHDGTVFVPTPVLVETITGDAGRDAEVNRVLHVLDEAVTVLQAPDEATARRAGRLRHRAKSDDGIDALVAAAAVGDGSPCVLLTSDPEDLGRLLVDEPQVAIRSV
ncbi:MAG: PIN domain-containing protein [Byssovorax sp.]